MSTRPDPEPSADENWILTTEETVRTTEEVVRTTDDTIERLTVTEDDAVAALIEVFGEAVDADYLPGKTRLRDAIAARFGLSELASEELCDALERSGRIEFVSGAFGAGWQLRALATLRPSVDRA